MMLAYKAWRESRVRFLVALGAACVYCLSVLVRARTEFPVPVAPGVPYTGFIWANVYGNAVPAVFSVVALVLGLGGLQRERGQHTVHMTLSLPVSRLRLIASRAIVGELELFVLAIVPMLVIPALSPLIAHHAYPAAVAARFAVLFVSWGSIWFAVGMIWSVVLGGEYAAAVAALLTPFVYMIVYAGISHGGRRFSTADPFTFMSGLDHLRPNAGTFADALPWAIVALLVSMALLLEALAVAVTARQSF